jgi:SAM-dependent methyltransferase
MMPSSAAVISSDDRSCLMNDPERTALSYDDVPYDVGPVAGAHPDRLAVTAMLWSIEPPDVEQCRILELGCSTGENLAALAVALPDAELHGIDASPAQIATGTERLRAIGLDNVALECRRIEELDTDGRPFDFILCHGVYSWVPLAVRERILAVTADLLVPNGLAYISFNTQPGWHMRQQLRNLLLFHLHGQAGAQDRIAQARALLVFLADTLEERTDAYGVLLRDEARALRDEWDPYLFHEFLEDVNEPEYFNDFVARAAAHGLQHIDDVGLTRHSRPPALTAAREALAAAGADRTALEQYTDFIVGRGFRRSVLCRRGVRLEEAAPGRVLPHLRVAAAVRAERDDQDVTTESTAAFRFGGGGRIETNHPTMKLALKVIGDRYPRSVAFAELCEAVPADTHEMLANWLHQCYRNGLVELHVWQPPFTLEPSPTPRASPLARHEAAADSGVVTSLRHARLTLQPFDRAVLAHLDGTLNRSEVAARLRQAEPGAASAEAPSAADVAEAVQRLALSALLLS